MWLKNSSHSVPEIHSICIQLSFSQFVKEGLHAKTPHPPLPRDVQRTYPTYPRLHSLLEGSVEWRKCPLLVLPCILHTHTPYNTCSYSDGAPSSSQHVHTHPLECVLCTRYDTLRALHSDLLSSELIKQVELGNQSCLRPWVKLYSSLIESTAGLKMTYSSLELSRLFPTCTLPDQLAVYSAAPPCCSPCCCSSCCCSTCCCSSCCSIFRSPCCRGCSSKISVIREESTTVLLVGFLI